MQRRNPQQQQQQQLGQLLNPASSNSTTTTSTTTQPTVIYKGTTTSVPQHQPPLLHTQQQQYAHLQQQLRSVNGDNSHSSRRSSNSKGSSSILRIWVLVSIVIILTFVISLFPEQRQIIYETEQKIEKAAYETEQQLEQEIMDYWLSSKHESYYTADDVEQQQRQNLNAADIRMRQQSSKWVDDEKKLKIALKELVERQGRGIDLGVPVLTRYLGDAVPVFYSTADSALNKGIATVEEWNLIIQQKYDTMRMEEDQWRQMIATTLLSSSDRG